MAANGLAGGALRGKHDPSVVSGRFVATRLPRDFPLHRARRDRVPRGDRRAYHRPAGSGVHDRQLSRCPAHDPHSGTHDLLPDDVLGAHRRSLFPRRSRRFGTGRRESSASARLWGGPDGPAARFELRIGTQRSRRRVSG